jgi:hypothetical protein
MERHLSDLALKKSDAFFFLVVGVMTFCIFYPFASIGIDSHHDGIMLKPAMDILSNQILFRESFTQYGALTTYIQSLFLGVFGATLKVLKLSTVCMYALSSSIFFYAGVVFCRFL